MICYSSPQQVICTWMKITKQVNFSARVVGGRDCYARGTFFLPRRSSWKSLDGKCQPSSDFVAKKLQHLTATQTSEMFITYSVKV